jgi:fatty-acyl-CoA synthase
MNVGQWIRKRADLHPDKTVIIFKDERISYGRLNQRSNMAAGALMSMGVRKGDRVAALLLNCPQFMELYFACSKIGAIFLPLNFRLTAHELEYQMRDSSPKALFFSGALSEVVGSLKGLLEKEDFRYLQVGDRGRADTASYEDLIANQATHEPDASVEFEDPQVIMYTSGTTSNAKGALLSHRKTYWNTFNAELFFGLRHDDVMLINLPLFHSGGLNVGMVPIIYKGATAVLHESFDPEKSCADIEKYRVTLFGGVPTMYNMILRGGYLDKYDLSSLRVLGAGGEAVPLFLIEEYQKLGVPFIQLFGQTETSIICSLSEADSVRKAGSIGRPVFHAEVKIVNEQGEETAPGEVGEIILSGPTLMTGYWNNPEATAETIRDGWLHTGDLAYRDDEGFLYFADRKKDMFISGGENVYPAEVESVLSEHPKISEVAVIGVSDETWGEVGEAYIVPVGVETVTEEEIKEFCDGKLARYKIPKRIVMVDEMPRTASGKVRKHLLRGSG